MFKRLSLFTAIAAVSLLSACGKSAPKTSNPEVSPAPAAAQQSTEAKATEEKQMTIALPEDGRPPEPEIKQEAEITQEPAKVETQVEAKAETQVEAKAETKEEAKVEAPVEAAPAAAEVKSADVSVTDDGLPPIVPNPELQFQP